MAAKNAAENGAILFEKNRLDFVHSDRATRADHAHFVQNAKHATSNLWVDSQRSRNAPPSHSAKVARAETANDNRWSCLVHGNISTFRDAFATARLVDRAKPSPGVGGPVDVIDVADDITDMNRAKMPAVLGTIAIIT